MLLQFEYMTHSSYHSKYNTVYLYILQYMLIYNVQKHVRDTVCVIFNRDIRIDHIIRVCRHYNKLAS